MKVALHRFVLYCTVFLCAGAPLGCQSLAETALEGRIRPYIALSPLKLADPVNRGFLGAAGAVWPSGWAIEGGYLWLLPGDPPAYNSYDKRGRRLHLAGRRYFVAKPNTPLVPFVQARGDLLYRTHRSVVRFQRADPPDNEFTVYDDSVGVDTRTQTLNLMVGVDWAITRQFAVEFSAGFGFRHRRVSYFDRVREDDIRFENLGNALFGSWNDDAGTFDTFNLPLDLRLIYRW